MVSMIPTGSANVSCVMREDSPVRLPNQVHASSPRKHTNVVWQDVLDICKKGFANKMSSLGDEIHTAVRSEVRLAATELRVEVEQLIDTNQRAVDSKLDEILEKLRIGFGPIDCSNLNMKPLVDEIKTSEIAQTDSLRAFSEQLETELARLAEQIQKVFAWTASEDVQVQQLKTRLQHAESQLDKILESSAALLLEATTSRVQCITENARLLDKFKGTLTRQWTVPASVNFNDVLSEMKKNRIEVNADFTLILHEIGKIQKALNIEYIDVTPAQAAHSDFGPQVALAASSNKFRSLVNEKQDSPPELVEDTSFKRRVVNILAKHGGKAFQAVQGDQSLSLGIRVKKRIREFCTQTDEVEQVDNWTQTDGKADRAWKRNSTMTTAVRRTDNRFTALNSKQATFADADTLKERARQALIKPAYNVTDYYHKKGCAQQIARSIMFDNITLFIVCLNTLWIAIDADYNHADTLADASTLFVVVENLFCFYFFIEIVIRFAAFATKLRAFKDGWFIFDSLLILIMILETWAIPLYVFISGSSVLSISASLIRVVRIVKMLRLSRMARLLRAIPELVIIMKGIGFAARSVMVFAALWTMILYIFAIVLKQLTEGLDIGDHFFPSVAQSMNTLLLYGLLPDFARIVTEVGGVSWYLWAIIIFFVLLASITIMYMLLGVLVDVVSVVSCTEKEGLTVNYVATQLREQIELLGYSWETELTRFEFERLLCHPEVATIISSVGVDVIVMYDMLDLVFEDLSKNHVAGIDFQKLVGLVLDMRGTNPARVKDLKEQMRFTKAFFQDFSTSVFKKLDEEFTNINATLNALKEEAHVRDAEGYDDDDPGLVPPFDSAIASMPVSISAELQP